MGKIGVIAALSARVLFLACASGIIGLGLGDTLYMLSLKTIGVSRAVPITCTYPLFSLVWAFLFAGETITPKVVFGAVAIIFGIWIISTSKMGETLEKSDEKLRLKGVVFAVLTAIAWSISISMINLAVKESQSLEQAYAVNTVRIMAVSVLLFSSLASMGKLGSLKVGLENAVMLLAGGLVAIGLGWFLLAFSFTLIPESQAAPISSTTPLFSTLASLAFLHEKVTAKIALGSIVVVAGIFMVFAS
jgi:DME family drug/metabolite transporter